MMYVGLIALFNLSITLIEVVFDAVFRKQRRWKDSGANALIFVLNTIAESTITGTVFFVMLLPFYLWFSPIEIPMTALTWVIAFVLADFTYYWMHRFEHKIRILWAHHSVHHSSEDFNLTIGYRLCLFEGLVEWIFLIPMIMLGFNPFQTVIAILLVAQYQGWIHTQHIRKLGWLDKIFNTPSTHRVHHGSNDQYLDKNFGGVFIIWDRLFGTYAAENEPVVYGLTENIKTNNPVLINIFEYRNILRDIRKCTTRQGKLNAIFGKLGAKLE